MGKEEANKATGTGLVVDITPKPLTSEQFVAATSSSGGFDLATFLNTPMSGGAAAYTMPIHTGLLFQNNDAEIEKLQLQIKLQAKDVELAQVKQEFLAQLSKRDRDQTRLKEKQLELEKQSRLSNILSSIEDAAQKLLLADESFADQFSKGSCSAYVMSVDIRKSTDLMLKTVKPSEFALFIRKLCDSLRLVVLSNHGVFDKFTGDGILAFFPDFYSGEDAGYLSVKAADECHRVFKATYEAHLDCFTTARNDAGLGIGIDCGQVDLVTNLEGLTVVGPPVVYACRFAGAPAHTTLLNQQAYKRIFERYSAFCSFERTAVAVKNEGDFAYPVVLNGKAYEPKQPPWLVQPTGTAKVKQDGKKE